jgi:hypothetical protein
MGFKLAKQEVDCYSDLSSTVSTLANNGRVLGISKAMENYRACLGNVDSSQGSIDFLKMQSERYWAGKP